MTGEITYVQPDYEALFTCLCKLTVQHLMALLSRRSRGYLFSVVCAKMVPTASSRSRGSVFLVCLLLGGL